MRDPLQGGTPADERRFIHRKILGFAGGIATRISNIPGVSFIPGSGILRTAGQIGTAFSTSGGRTSTGFSGGRGGGERVPPDIRNVLEARNRMAQANAVATSGGDCLPAVASCKPCRTNRSGYYVQSQPGNPAAGGLWVPRDSVCTRSRRMNPGNASAARRAVRRLKSFDNLARNVERELKKIVRTSPRARK